MFSFIDSVEYYNNFIEGFLNFLNEYKKYNFDVVRLLLEEEVDNNLKDEVYDKLLLYLIVLNSSYSYKSVLEFLVYIGSKDSKLDNRLLEQKIKEDGRISYLLSVAKEERIKVNKNIHLYAPSKEDLVLCIYTEEVLGYKLDLKNISTEEIDNIVNSAARYKKKNLFILLEPLFDYLKTEYRYDLLFYMLNEYITDSIIENNTSISIDNRNYPYIYLNHFRDMFMELTEVEKVKLDILGLDYTIDINENLRPMYFLLIEDIKKEIISLKKKEKYKIQDSLYTLLEKTESQDLSKIILNYLDDSTDIPLMNLLNAWSTKDNRNLEIIRNELIFKDENYRKQIEVDDRSINNLVKIFNICIKENKSIEDMEKTIFIYQVVSLLLSLSKNKEAGEFIYSNKKYYKLESLKGLLLLTITSIVSNRFETLDILYGMFIAEKSYIDLNKKIFKLENKNTIHLIKNLQRYLSDENIEYLAEEYVKKDKDVKITNIKGESYEEEKKSNYKNELLKYRYLYFENTNTLEYIDRRINIDKMTGIQLLNFFEELKEPIRAIYTDGRIKSKEEYIYINFSNNLDEYKDEKNYVENKLIAKELKEEARRIYERLEKIENYVKNIRYDTFYGLVDIILKRKQSFMYLTEIENIVNNSLMRVPKRYKEVLDNSFSVNKAEILFKNNYKNHKENFVINEYYHRKFFHSDYKNLKGFRKKEYREAFNAFVNIYNKEDKGYEDILIDDELKHIILTVEWLWDKEINSYKTATLEESFYLIASYLKAVEIYLFKKINFSLNKTRKKIYLNENISFSQMYNFVFDNREILDKELNEKIENCEKDFYIKNRWDRMKHNPIISYLKLFTDRVEKGQFHDKAYYDIDKLEEIRNDCLYLLRRISTDFI